MNRPAPSRHPLDHAGLAALLSLAWFAATAWTRPLMLPDEGRYVGVAWEMLARGDWLTPTLDGLPYFHKPPLFHWLTLLAMSVLGPGDGAARAAPVLGASLGALALFLFVRRWQDSDSAWRVLPVLLCQPLYFLGGQFANMDMLVAGCVSATILALVHVVLAIEHREPHRPALLAAHALGALGVLAKGLIGVVLPVLVVLAWLLLTRRWRHLPALLWPPALAVFGAVVAPWFALMEQQHPGFLHYFFVVQHFRRYAASGFNNVQPFWFYPALLAVASLPWLPWLGALLQRAFWFDLWRSLLRPSNTLSAASGGAVWRGAERSAESWRPLRPAELAAAIRLPMLLWLFAITLFFSLPASKPPGYILPVVPPLAWLMAEGIASARRRQQLWLASAGVSLLLSLGYVTREAMYPERSWAELGQTLRAARQTGEPVTMLDNYYFDLPYYARLDEPVRVVTDWHSPDIAAHDDWRKELLDAGTLFAPVAASHRLIQPVALPAALCNAPVQWLIGPLGSGPAFLQHVAPITVQRDNALWRLDIRQPEIAAALNCAEHR